MAIGEVADRVEVVGAVAARQEEVEDLLALVLHTRLVQVGITHEFTRELALGVLGVEEVRVPELVRAEAHDRDIARAVAAGERLVRRADGVEWRGGGADADVREILARRRLLQARVIALREADLGGEGIGPVRVQLQRERLVVLAREVPLRVEAGAAGAEVGALDDARLRLAVGQGGALVIGDVPVEARRVLLVGDRLGQRDAAEREGRTIGVGEHIGDGVDIRLCHRRAARAVDGGGEACPDGTDGGGVEGLVVLVGERKEQRVLDDRAAEGGAVVVLLDQRLDRGLLDLGADQIIVQEVREHRTAELVGALTQHDVDRTAEEVAVLDIEGNRLHRELLDRVDGDRAAAGRQTAGVETEVVLRLHAIDGDAVGSRVGAGDRDATVAAQVGGD